MRLGDTDQALALAEQVIAYGKSLNDDAIIAKGMLTKVYVLFDKAEIDAAHRLAFAAEKVAMGTDNAALRTQATITAGQTYAEQGNFPQALVKLQQALDLSRTVRDDPAMPAAALNALTTLYTQMKEYDKALADAEEVLSRQKATDGGMSLRSKELGIIEKLVEEIRKFVPKKEE